MLVDSFNRKINYLRMSVTDRCDLRCTYCMKEKMEFLPKDDVLTLEQIERLCEIFIDRGVKKIRLTGGEPLVRKNIMSLIKNLGKKIDKSNLEELTLTTNGSLLKKYSKDLYENGVRRINVSLDTLDPTKYNNITRRGDLKKVLDGIYSAINEKIKVKINIVALKNFNENEFNKIFLWCASHKIDLTFIEVMPMGETEQHRFNQFLPLDEIRNKLINNFNLTPSKYNTGGPSRYLYSEKYKINIGFITPLSHNFCSNCNRIRITCTGRLYMCLGQDNHIDFKKLLKEDYSNIEINKLIDKAMTLKPQAHNFVIEKNSKPYLQRFMNTTGG